MTTFNHIQFAEKYQLALRSIKTEKPEGGLNGVELEWNLLDERFRPLLTVGSGPAKLSFVDYLRSECLQTDLVHFSQLEVFHWMVEFATQPYYQPKGVIFETRLMEAILINALKKAGQNFDEKLFYWHGNLLFLTDINHGSIPGNWSIAKRRYLERCVDLYGNTLSTAGIHINLSLPDPLFTWDFMHLPPNERNTKHLDQYKSEFYITATRCLRPFASLFIATSASTPLQAQFRKGKSTVVLTDFDSVRNLTFPNPSEIDQADLYRSYKDYKTVSYDLVNRGIRFGNNNWTPVRARSFAEPVERLISTTGDQLNELYTRGLYSIGETTPPEEMARQIEKQNLLARINLPMGRVEIRTDDGGHPIATDLANLTLKHLLLIRIYGDPTFARSFRYDREDINRARGNEFLASQKGLDSDIENPLTGKPVGMREFLKWTLNQLQPLADELGMSEDLHPLWEMANGGSNTSNKLRIEIKKLIGDSDEVPVEILQQIAYERQDLILKEMNLISANLGSIQSESGKLIHILTSARTQALSEPQLPIRFRPTTDLPLDGNYLDKTAEIVDLASSLIRIPSITACPIERLDQVHKAGSMIYDYLRKNGLSVRYFDGKYPAVLASFSDGVTPTDHVKPGRILITGHFDVVEPEPDDSQFDVYIEGDYLVGRGSADMKTVVATYMVWMKDLQKQGGKYPDISLLLVGNEENGEGESWGTPHILEKLKNDFQYTPSFFIAGERTGEKGDEIYGEICIQNRGVMRFEILAHGNKGHTGLAGTGDLSEKLINARSDLNGIFEKYLKLSSSDGWHSQVKFPFIQVGTPGVYNISAAEGLLGVEIRPIPQDDINRLKKEVSKYCEENQLKITFTGNEAGVACDEQNPALISLLKAIGTVSGETPKLGKKLAGTSARFAPGGQAVVWGQSGIGPHSKSERHFIPSIEPYYRCLLEFAKETL